MLVSYKNLEKVCFGGKGAKKMLSINQEKPTKVTEKVYIILQVYFYQTSVCSHYGTGGKIV